MFQSPSTEPLASSSFPPTLTRAQSFLDARAALDEGKRNRSLSDLQVRGGVFRRGPIDYNGCGAFLGTADGRKRESRCGNCGDFDHITVDCTLLTLSPDASAPPHSYIQKERRRSNSLLEMCKEESDKLALEQGPSHTKVDADDPLAIA
ncbi:hypothetical protein SPRG_06477 [Saprolegnia parasitica CBS 223.65]|uniref:Uncharacterized protein n=1 Tax=Saprolegnia parasitica (strain CBS 223.65) TaxID=695850 RepID=A0A067CQ22_SAPPC|nr:hypothetical protein SPRG_06477 [Saprolegnia parasitica CBS 223.65]KDO28621.1 hypothetical protein SPRG_06477 [Saprolegnia parasitica CBS 223.65]|eukprot:XP_012200684.1 hypothetical protein SPRG_06477 [Saprolegnia parasitica CBS 223.65]